MRPRDLERRPPSTSRPRAAPGRVNDRLFRSEANLSQPQRMAALRPWCCSLHCGMSIEPYLCHCRDEFRSKVHLTEQDGVEGRVANAVEIP